MPKEKQRSRGVFVVKQFRNGKLIATRKWKNLTTTAGQNYLLATGFNGGSAISTWFMGLMDNTAFTGGVVGDTMASHGGWTEFITYSGGVRKTWGSGAPSGGSITNGTAVSFTITTAGTIAGYFVTSSNTLSGTSGTLWNTIARGTPLVVAIADVINVTYTYSLT